MSAHTPGPWKVGEASGDILGPSGETIACYPPPESEEDEARWSVNAPVIAAAPDLLAALERLTDRVDPATKVDRSIKSFSEAIDQARAAIAKARGTP